MTDVEGCALAVFAACLFIVGLVLGFHACPHERIYDMGQGIIIKKASENGNLCVFISEENKIEKFYITKHEYSTIEEGCKYTFSKRDRVTNSIGAFVEINIMEEVK